MLAIATGASPVEQKKVESGGEGGKKHSSRKSKEREQRIEEEIVTRCGKKKRGNRSKRVAKVRRAREVFVAFWEPPRFVLYVHEEVALKAVLIGEGVCEDEGVSDPLPTSGRESLGFGYECK